MKTILVTGTPGTGKTRLCVRLLEQLSTLGKSVQIIHVSDLIKEEKLYDEYDPGLDTYLIDDRKVCKHLENTIRGMMNQDVLVIETHTVTTIPRRLPERVAVLTARTDVLYDRLVARGYKGEKLDENMECEIMRIIFEEAVGRFGEGRVLELPSNTEEDIEDNLEAILEELSTL